MSVEQTDNPFQVVFEGAMTGEFSPEDSKHRFGRLFRIDGARLDRMFSGKTIVIKKNMTEDQAMHYAIKIAEAGCECYFEPMPREGEEFIDEKRRQGERRMRFRRGPRPGAIVPDRRVKIRRTIDQEIFDELHLKNLEIPVGFNSYPKK